MPVIRGQSRGSVLADDRRKALIQTLQDELAGNSSSAAAPPKSPLVFEIPLERLDGTSDRFDVLVVWDEFKGIRSEDRITLILDAYRDQADKIAQAMGATESEVWEQDLLPHTIRPIALPDKKKMNEEMLKEGGIQIGVDEVVLAFPTKRMAEAAMRRLVERLPKVGWVVGKFAGKSDLSELPE